MTRKERKAFAVVEKYLSINEDIEFIKFSINQDGYRQVETKYKDGVLEMEQAKY